MKIFKALFFANDRNTKKYANDQANWMENWEFCIYNTESHRLYLIVSILAELKHQQLKREKNKIRDSNTKSRLTRDNNNREKSDMLRKKKR